MGWGGAGTLYHDMTDQTRPQRAQRRTRRPPKPLEQRAASTLAPLEAAELDASYVPTGFADLGVPENVDRGLAAAGFNAPFAIQTKAIPVALQGLDVCGRARTGSGKTLAFGVPMLARLSGKAQPRRPLGLVLVPTRELALQVAEVLDPVARRCDCRQTVIPRTRRNLSVLRVSAITRSPRPARSTSYISSSTRRARAPTACVNACSTWAR